MAKNDNAHALRLAESLEKNIGKQAAVDFSEKYPLSKSADIKKKFAWANHVCEYLEQNYDKAAILNIRKDCRCNDGKSIAGKLRKYLCQADNIEEFVKRFNQAESFASLEYISEHKILFCYPECYCACVKRVPEKLPQTWCLCTLGNAEGIFRTLFEKDVCVRLLQSIKSGAEKCVIEVKW